MNHHHIQESSIKCVFFSEFHHTAGPKITFQVPNDYVSKEVFDNVSVYIIPKEEIQGKLITVNALGHKIIGHPVGIYNTQYARNRLIFNLCFVCDAWMRTVQYEAIVRKLAYYLVTLELECGFLSCKESKEKLPEIMSQIREELNRHGYCSIPINESTTIHLKVIRIHQDPMEVKDHHVPVFTHTRNSFHPNKWDLTTQQILPYIDGLRHVARIAAEADVEVSLVKACIQNMVYYGVVTLIPIFQYSNVYTATPELTKLAENAALQEECIKFVGKQERNLPSFRSVFMLYCGLGPGITVRDLCMRHNPHAVRVDERKLIQFGMMKGLIRRLQKYPIQIIRDNRATAKQKSFAKYFTGNHSYDDICCKTGLSYQELDEIVEEDVSVVVCWK